jgi:hypothetical protein
MVRLIKSSFLFGVLLLVTAVVGMGAIPLCDYQSFDTDISDLDIGFSYHYHNDPYGLSEHDVSEGELHIGYDRLYDSPDFGFDITVRNDMNISTLTLSSFLVTGEGNLRRYFTTDAPYFGIAGVSARSASSYETIGLFVKLGIGYGRFTDVTPLAKAIKIDAYLHAKGSISAHLDQTVLKSLAYEIDNIDTYDSMTDLLGALQEIIEGPSTGELKQLDALDVYEMAQIVEDNDYTRYCGGSINAGIGYELLDPMKRSNDLLATAAFNYAFTTTPQVQFLIKGIFSGAYDFLRTNQIEITACYDYFISNIVSLSSEYSFSRETWDSTVTDKHNLKFDLVLTPVEGANITLGFQFGHEPYFLEWSQDVKFTIGMRLL